MILIARSQELMDLSGFSRALDTALQNLIRTAADWHSKGAPLSPLDVVVISQDGSIRPVFSGEDAALNVKAAESLRSATLIGRVRARRSSACCGCSPKPRPQRRC